MNIGKLFDGGFDKDAIDKIVQERIAESMPTMNNQIYFVRQTRHTIIYSRNSYR